MTEEIDLGHPQDAMIVDAQGRHTIAIDLHHEQDRLYLVDQGHHPMDRGDQHVNALPAQTVELSAEVDQAMAPALQIGDVSYHYYWETNGTTILLLVAIFRLKNSQTIAD